MIDVVENVVPGKSSAGFKNLTANDWFFKCHFPGDPNMPGLLQVEAIVQIAALAILTMEGNKGKVMYLTSANNMKFIKKIIPNSRLDIETQVRSFKRGLAICEGIGLVKKEIVCKAEFNLILPEEIKKYNLKKTGY